MSFELFPTLPPEIRTIIWKTAFHLSACTLYEGIYIEEIPCVHRQDTPGRYWSYDLHPGSDIRCFYDGLDTPHGTILLAGGESARRQNAAILICPQTGLRALLHTSSSARRAVLEGLRERVKHVKRKEEKWVAEGRIVRHEARVRDGDTLLIVVESVLETLKSGVGGPASVQDEDRETSSRG